MNIVIDFLKEIFMYHNIKYNDKELLIDSEVYDILPHNHHFRFSNYNSSYVMIGNDNLALSFITFYNDEFYIGLFNTSIGFHCVDKELTNLYLLYTRKKKLEFLEKIQ